MSFDLFVLEDSCWCTFSPLVWAREIISSVYQLLAHGRWVSPGTPASSTTKTGRHDIAETLLKLKCIVHV
jgi:hypothetical protein